jgi:two-component system cell cycle sensor histidine kinase/response regulator CckA
MRRFHDLPIRYKLTTLFGAMALLTAISVSVPMGAYDYFATRRAMAQELTSLADVVARNSTAALTFHDQGSAHDVLQALQAESNVTAACIYTNEGRPFAVYVRDGKETAFAPPAPRSSTVQFEPDRLLQFREIVLANEKVGTLYIESDLGKLQSRIRQYNLAFLATLALTLSLAVLAGARLQRPISGPLLDLVNTATIISDAGDYSIRADLVQQDEFGQLVSAFNGMLEQIEKRDHELRLHREHLGEQVASRTTALSDANKQLTLQAAALQAAANSIVITDRTGTIVWTNPAFSAETGYRPEEVLGQNAKLLSSGRQDQLFYSHLWGTIASGRIWRGEIINRRKDGSLYTEEMTITPVLSDNVEITHFVAIKQNITDRKIAEQALRRAEEKYRGIFEDAVVGIYQSSPEGKVLSVNRALAEMCGYDSPEQLMAGITDLAADLYHDPACRAEFVRLLNENGVVRNFEYQARRKDGARIWLLQNARTVKNEEGDLLYYEGSIHDITERKALEDQLRQAQKMEAVGRLAGGVAHDFNNALGVIMGYGQVLQLTLLPEDTRYKQIEEIVNAGRRAASLTRQLLAFSRKQTIQPVVLDLNSVVTETEKMLQRLIGEDVDLRIIRESKLKSIKADRGQIEQVLMNLAVNARDAMPTGGKLVIETANSELTDSDVRDHPYLKPGRYVALRVSDTGSGMNQNTQAHIFEPFFTTKETGKGTGLGLSTVYGIVKQSDGFIVVDSEVGNGTTFHIYFPEIEVPKKAIDVHETPRPLPRGTETILLVEDEESLRALTRGCLSSVGYTVLESADGKAALDFAQQHSARIDLLLTDVVMPGLSGRELAERLTLSRPDLKVLYMSGYTQDRITQHGILDPALALLEKPFTIDALLTRVRDLLDNRLSRSASTQ